jgi:hypothetical protein
MEHELPVNYTVCVAPGNMMVESSPDNNCTSVGDATLYTMTGVKPQTEYLVSVKAQSYAGIGPGAVVHVTSMKNGWYHSIHYD